VNCYFETVYLILFLYYMYTMISLITIHHDDRYETEAY